MKFKGTVQTQVSCIAGLTPALISRADDQSRFEGRFGWRNKWQIHALEFHRSSDNRL